MIKVKLRDAMDQYRRRTGERITYQVLAARTGLARSTIESIAARSQYNAGLNTIDKICSALGCTPGDLLHHRASDGNAGKFRR